MAEDRVSRETHDVRYGQPRRKPVDLTFAPLDGKRDRRTEEIVEIEGVMRVLPEVVGVDEKMFSNRLLKAPVELVTKARLDGHSG